MYFINLSKFFGHYLFNSCFCKNLSSLSLPVLQSHVCIFNKTQPMSGPSLCVRQDSVRIGKPGGLLSPAREDWANSYL